ncbi:4-hydroxy-tetrahydrodipicolinate reductase [Blastopirellula marina]|uniref:4-hydroxy-tetrahydrodipicolinate reductase n=1 Tax=Blastopirellula marina TaxID=124 RepID=A0A2S8F8J9_9BACT|nr:4-hydroxy-tetrahydrodipicolinate reductase [Blastopirellula marina]PQO28244.1 4-hydroxy-tetrahydrodipicolinate reductase [Blastopirellula marina]PTL41784.1 4-hydroxy-tetrahydrodipicolinate reductase [Blastopirellula marina]
MPTKVAINGAAGRMGQRLVALGCQDESLELVACFEYSGHPKFGQDAGNIAGVGELGLHLIDHTDEAYDAIIDFSVPEGAHAAVERAVAAKAALVMATTGLEEEHKAKIREAANVIPVVWAPSMSTTVNLTMKLCEIAAEALKDVPGGADVEILERHHRFKEDSPSGTALRFGELIANKMGITRHIHGREGRPGARPHDEIAYHAIRTGDNPGEHTIIFGLLGETMELTVRASNRDCYASGALQAAKFAAGKPPGLYNMNDVLGL